MQIYLARNNQQAGPYSLEQVNQMLANQQVLLTDLAWHDGMAEWKPLGELTQGKLLYQPEGHQPATTPFTGLNKAQQQVDTHPQLEHASLGRRAVAKIIDLAPWILAFAIPNLAMNDAQHTQMMAVQEQFFNQAITATQVQQKMLEIIPQQGWIAMFVYIFLMLFVQAILLARTGQSIGKKITGIQIVDHQTGEKVSLTRVFLLRSIVVIMLNLFFIPVILSIIDYMFALSDKKQTLHDKLAKTKVIQLKK